MPDIDDASSGLLGLWWRDLCDRARGESARANARWGFLSAPSGPGRLIWIKAGSDDDSLLLGAELTRAIRRKRLDVRLAYTFERDIPLVDRWLQGLKGIGVGYGPIERSRPVNRVLSRFAPMGVVFAGTAPGSILSNALSVRRSHSAVIAAPPRPGTRVDVAYPANRLQAQAWGTMGGASDVAPPADPLALLVEAQVDPNFKTVVTGGRDLHLWWLDGVNTNEAARTAAVWRDCALREGSVLFVSGDADAAWPGRDEIIRLHEWRREPVRPGTVMLVDDARWRPAVAASVTAAHLMRPTRSVFWQALSGGCPVSLGDAVARDYLNDPVESDVLPVLASVSEVLARWQQDAARVIAARRCGDALRRLFWQERRRASELGDRLLQRVYDW